MCCFSRDVHVSNTRIFVRPGKDHGQFIVYSMKMEAKEEGAMVLPLPVQIGSGEKAVRFINLEKYPKFFDDLKKGFAEPAQGRARGEWESNEAKLAVEQVGAYEASYVPTIADFSRLDPRFRLPDGTWEKFKGYEDYGFAVFKLKAGTHEVHPMAFEFPRRDPKSLFFPTVHVHDGEVHAEATFDHSLYCQAGGLVLRDLLHWRESDGPASSHVKLDKSQGVIEGDEHCYVRKVRGKQKNIDIVLRQEV